MMLDLSQAVSLFVCAMLLASALVLIHFLSIVRQLAPINPISKKRNYADAFRTALTSEADDATPSVLHF